MSDGYFDAEVAKTYDDDAGRTDPALIAATVDVLADLAGAGPVLEFAVGTGRIALPLAARGLEVKGIELSRPMVNQLRAKETGAPMQVTIGDMTSARVEGAFSLVFLIFNTIDNLTTQGAQVAVFENAARHLAPGGRFVVETLVPPIQKLPYGQRLLAFDCTEEHTGVDEFDVVTQAYWSHHAWNRQDGVTPFSVPFRYAWPAEMDLMARIAGMVPERRWADWHRVPFSATSDSHVSVWRKPE